jgi:type I restriction enzyme S subunit
MPPLDEQKQIEAAIEVEVNRLYEARKPLEKSIRKLEEYRSAIITCAITGKITGLQ